MNIQNRKRVAKGSVLVFSLIILSIMLSAALSILSVTLMEKKSSFSTEKSVQAFDVAEANGYHYFVMEYVEGHTIYDELAGGKVFSEAEALKVIIQIARALEHAHSKGLIHRDVKPKNIMMTKGGMAKLADMGLARAASDSQAAQAEAGRAFGTPYYISPEQIRGEGGSPRASISVRFPGQSMMGVLMVLRALPGQPRWAHFSRNRSRKLLVKPRWRPRLPISTRKV